MEIRERIEGNTFGPLKPIAEQPLTAHEMTLFAALAVLEAQREQDKMDNLLVLAELAATIEGGK